MSSIKGALGHAMGAAAAIETIIAICALRDRILPPNTGTQDVDPSIEVDVVQSARPAPDLDWVMNCAYAFGGLNSALMIGRAS